MFCCGQCQYEASSKDLLKCHQDSLHQEEKYNRNICGIQVLRREILVQHKIILLNNYVMNKLFKLCIYQRPDEEIGPLK